MLPTKQYFPSSWARSAEIDSDDDNGDATSETELDGKARTADADEDEDEDEEEVEDSKLVQSVALPGVSTPSARPFPPNNTTAGTTRPDTLPRPHAQLPTPLQTSLPSQPSSSSSTYKAFPANWQLPSDAGLQAARRSQSVSGAGADRVQGEEGYRPRLLSIHQGFHSEKTVLASQAMTPTPTPAALRRKSPVANLNTLPQGQTDRSIAADAHALPAPPPVAPQAEGTTSTRIHPRPSVISSVGTEESSDLSERANTHASHDSRPSYTTDFSDSHRNVRYKPPSSSDWYGDNG